MAAASSSSPYHRPRLHPAIGPFFLLTVLTSLAFNRATLARQAREDQRQHLVQINLLQDELRKLTLPKNASEKASSWSSWLWRSKSTTLAAPANPTRERGAAEEEESLARKCLAVGLDPKRLGISPQHIPNLSSSEGEGSDVTWSEALFGKGTWGKMKTSLIEAGAALRASVGAGFGDKDGETSATGAGGGAKEQDEYEAAFLQYAQRLEEEERSKAKAPPVAVRSKQDEPTPTQYGTISTINTPVALGNDTSDAVDGPSNTAQSDQAPARRRFIV